MSREGRPAPTGGVVVKEKDGQMVLQAPTQQRQPLSLACILNTIDGIRENHGRIIVLSSNHYGQLDPALTRAGRIDIEICMGNADIDVLDEIHTEHFGFGMSARWKNCLSDEFEMAPCDIVNCVKGGCTSDEFLGEIAIRYKEKKDSGKLILQKASSLRRSGLATPPPPPPPPPSTKGCAFGKWYPNSNHK